MRRQGAQRAERRGRRLRLCDSRRVRVTLNIASRSSRLPCRWRIARGRRGAGAGIGCGCHSPISVVGVFVCREVRVGSTGPSDCGVRLG